MIVEIVGALQFILNVEQTEVAFQISLLLGGRGAVAYINGLFLLTGTVYTNDSIICNIK